MASSSGQEFKLRVPKNLVKDYYIMKVCSARPVKIDTVSEAYLARKETQYAEDSANAAPLFGAGSVYGKERKEEARKKRRGYVTKEVKPEDMPFSMRLGAKESKTKMYSGKKEGGILDNSSYYVLTQCPDGVFEAVPVHAWFNFTPDINYTTMTADEAEFEFSKRDKTINYWNLKIKKQLDEKDDEDAEDKKSKVDSREGELKIHDDEQLSDAVEVEEFSDSDSDDGNKSKKKKKKPADKKKPGTKKSRKKGSDDDEHDSDEEEELENAESKEVDYLSESSGEELELEDEPEPEKADAKPKDDLNAAMLSESSEDEDENEEGEKLTDVGKELKQMLHRDDKEGSSADEDEEDDDIDGDDEKYSNSAVFMQGKDGKKKRTSGGSDPGSASNSRSGTPTLSSDAVAAVAGSSGASTPNAKRKAGGKRPLHATPSPSSKKAKVSNSETKATAAEAPQSSKHHSHHHSRAVPDDDDEEGAITEKAIRRYLSHKPMTTTDLVRKFKRKRTGLTKKQTVDTIAAILKKIEPQRVHKDNVLYLSLKPK